MDKTIGQRIRRLRQEKGLSQQDIAAAVGVSRAAVSQWESGATAKLEGGNLVKLAQALGVTTNWLALGEEGGEAEKINYTEDAIKKEEAHESAVAPEEQHRDKQHSQTAGETHGTKVAPGFVMVPRYDVSAGMGNGVVVNGENVVDLIALQKRWVTYELGVDPRNLALISAIGDSMEPTLRPGDMILIDGSIKEVKTDSIYVIAIDDMLLAKRIQRLVDGSLVIKSDNPAYEKQIIQADQAYRVRIIGRVVWAGRRM